MKLDDKDKEIAALKLKLDIAIKTIAHVFHYMGGRPHEQNDMNLTWMALMRQIFDSSTEEKELTGPHDLS